ncbi:hypothetical protein IZU27_02615 [Treponema socranskii]|uniref:hypothetical protein n=1 Tax=Treponema socranskii TaxID=53419 RepID=UPI003D6ECBD4
MNSRIKELEDTILDQIEKLNDDSLAGDAEETQRMIDRSKSIAELTNAYVNVNRMKLDVVKELNRSGTLYEGYLGINDGKI